MKSQSERGQDVATIVAQTVARLDSVVDLTGSDLAGDRRQILVRSGTLRYIVRYAVLLRLAVGRFWPALGPVGGRVLADAAQPGWIADEFGLDWAFADPSVDCIRHHSREEAMSHVTYKIVQHDGGWAYTVDGVFSEPFASHAAALTAAKRVAAEQRVPGRTEAIEYETSDGKWHIETAPGSDRPETDVEDTP